MADVTLVVLGTSWCGYCKSMKKTRVAERFAEKHPEVEVKDLMLPDNWGDEDELAPAERKKLIAARSADEKKAIEIAAKNEVQGVPFVGFFDAEGTKMVESDGAVNLAQLERLYEKAVEMLEDEGDDDDDTEDEDGEDDDT